MNSRHASIFILSQLILLAPPISLAEEPPVTVEAFPEHLLYLYARPAPTVSGALVREQVTVDSTHQWENGRTLRVCLFSGNQTIATLIAEVASEWNNHSGVQLDFGGASGWYNCLSPSRGFFQIRIGFSEKGYWSTMGKDSESLMDALAPSMNFEHFNMIYSASKFSPKDVAAQARPYDKTVIRHEFGHALGLVHEMQNPEMHCADEIKWEGKDNVYEYFAEPPNSWQPEKVKINLGFFDQGKIIPGQGDRHSIMLYPLPARIFKKGEQSHCFTNVNYELSSLDKKAVSDMYPQGNAAPLSGDLDIAGANIKAMPTLASAPTRADTLSRVKVDLESTDPFIRRDARARLADLMPSAPISDIDALVLDMRQSSYRYKLGVAVALANQRDKIVLNASTRARLAQEIKEAKDPILKKNLLQASK